MTSAVANLKSHDFSYDPKIKHNMQSNYLFRRLLGALACALVTVLPTGGCGGSSDEKGEVLILAAASTQDAIKDVAAAFENKYDATVRINAASSSQLATQIVNGAPGDIYLSANEKWASHIEENGFAVKSKILLGNSLVMVVPKDQESYANSPEELVTEMVKRVAVAGPKVPAGIYARQSLRKLNLLDRLKKENKLVIGENVRTTLAYVERGEVDAGIVYATDALISRRVKTVYTFPANAHDPIRYPAVLLKSGADNKSARLFYEFLTSAQAVSIFEKYGFVSFAP